MKTLSRRDGSGLDLRHPTSEFNQLVAEMDTLLDQAFEAFGRPQLIAQAFTPLADIEETDDAFTIEIELPGMKREDISVEVHGRRVVVSGERKERERKGILRTKKRVMGRFLFEAVLPVDIDVDGVTATYNNGLLSLNAPKAETSRSKVRKVEIN
jgi:HSP20 family protein